MRRAAFHALAACLCLLAGTAQAALQDEVQVYTDDINAPGERSLELHVNTTPSGRASPDYPGEVVSLHGLRITPEFGYGISKTVDVGLYVPTVRDQSGHWTVPGVKLRLKWLPLQTEETADGRVGFFAGVNFELSSLAYRFDAARQNLEMRNIVGYRAASWSVAANPTFSWGLTPGNRGAPEFSLGLRAMRVTGPSSQAGLEVYDTLGRVGALDAPSQRDRRLFAVWEHELKSGWGVHLGVGRGYGTGDRYTLKSILSVPIDTH